MKKCLKVILCIVGAVGIIALLFWIGFSYITEYKKVTIDTSHSPDGQYELLLQAVGEPDWPFGSASGRLVLREGEDKIIQTNFELLNDGTSISSSCWKVTWNETNVDVILSGEEQLDEEVVLYFDGTVDSQSDTDNDISSKDTVITENISSNLTVDSETQTSYYKKYNGNWSTNGQSNADIIKNGTIFHVEIVNDDELQGYLYSLQGISERFAEIDDITSKIINGECSYAFSDDGWGNSGILFIQLKEDEINIEVKDFILSDQNSSGFGISGSYKLIPMKDSTVASGTESVSEEIDWQDTSLQKYSTDWQESQILKEIEKRKPYADSCSFYPEFLQYMENVREVCDISMYLAPLYDTDTKYYQASDFDDIPPLIIYLAKNEIYARHGYTFKDTELNSYFLSQLWYLPNSDLKNFDTSVFNEYETANLQLLAQLDTYK